MSVLWKGKAPMKPVYVCDMCQFAFDEYDSEPHSVLNNARNHRCIGTLQPYFSAIDLKQWINENKFSTDDDGMNESYDCVEVESLLAALEGGEG